MAKEKLYLPDSGLCLATKSVLQRRTPVKWLFRERSTIPQDNGWRILGATDTDEYVSDSNNLEVASYNRVCNIEPMLVYVYDFAVGSDFQIVFDEHGKHIVDTPTGVEIPEEEYYRPGMIARSWGDRTPGFRGS